MSAPTEITVAQLAKLNGLPDQPLLVDCRLDEDVATDATLLPGAVRHRHDSTETLVLPDGVKRVVLYCQKGRKISQGAAAMLRTRGIQAETLEGGHFAWRDARHPLVPIDAMPARDSSGRTLWVTRHRPKIDRIACPWLILRFVDPRARFLFVAPSEVMGVADRFGATPFDVPDVRFSHRGELCSFDVMLEEWTLTTQALLTVARIVRGADTERLDLAPEAAGLLAMSLGLSRMYRDDLAQLSAGLTIYDALYRWARDAQDERHDWNPEGIRS